MDAEGRHGARRERSPGRASGESVGRGGSAEADECARADATAAAEARRCLAREPLAELEPDGAIARMLCGGEHLLAVRRGAVLDRRQPPRGNGTGLAGDLYLTSARLVLLGRVVVSYDLVDLTEVALAGERLLLVARNGTGASLDVDRPRVLRVEIAAARMATAR